MPLLLAHQCGKEFGFHHNSLSSIKLALERGYDIIKLNVRKSKDGVLYCHHASVFQELFPTLTLNNKNCSYLEWKFHVLKLADALETIGSSAAVSLNIEQNTILPEDILENIHGKLPKAIYLAGAFSAERQQDFTTKLARCRFVHITQWAWKPNFKKLADIGINIVQLYGWQLNDNTAAQLQALNMKPTLNPEYITKGSYKKKAIKYNIEYVHSNMI